MMLHPTVLKRMHARSDVRDTLSVAHTAFVLRFCPTLLEKARKDPAYADLLLEIAAAMAPQQRRRRD